MAESYISELGDSLSHGVANTNGDRVKIIAPKLYNDGNGNHPSIATALSGKAASNHTHGNIQNGGTLQTDDITIASGDKLVVTDSSDASKVARASISFDGSTTTQALTKAGTWEKMLVPSDLYSIRIPANADLNNYNTDNRIYQCNNTNASSVSNRPSGATGAFDLEVIRGTGESCVQIYYSRDDVSFNYIRKYTGDNKWTAWNRISLASDAKGIVIKEIDGENVICFE